MKSLKSPGKLRVTRCPRDLGRGYVIWDGFAHDSPLTIYSSKEAALAALLNRGGAGLNMLTLTTAVPDAEGETWCWLRRDGQIILAFCADRANPEETALLAGAEGRWESNLDGTATAVLD